MEKKNKILAIRLPIELHQWIKVTAYSNEMTLQDFVCLILEEYTKLYKNQISCKIDK